MFCGKCGEAYVEGERICRKCDSILKDKDSAGSTGTRETTGDIGRYKNKRKKKGIPSAVMKKGKQIVISVVSFVLFIILIFIIGNLGKRDFMFEFVTNPLMKYESDNSTFFFGQKNEKISFDVLGWTQYSLDNSKAAFLGSDKVLFFVSNKEKIEISGNVHEFAVSDDGNGIAYLVDYNADDKAGTLMLYDVNTRKSVQIVRDYDIRGILLSPDGKSVAYYTMNENGVDFSGYLSVAGDVPVKLGDNMKYIAVSNGALFAYYLEYSPDNIFNLFVRKDSGDIKLIESSAPVTMCLNTEYNEILFVHDEKTYISVDGEEKLKVINGEAWLPLTPNNAPAMHKESENVRIFRVKTFADKILTGGTGKALYYLKSNYDSFKILQSHNGAIISKNGKSIIYKDDSGSIYKISGVSDENADAVKLSRGSDADISVFKASPDLSRVYYINGDKELWFVDGKNASVKIQDDVVPGVLEMKDNNAFFLKDSYELYCSKNGGKKILIKTDKEVDSLRYSISGIIYYIKSGATRDVFFSKGDENFIKLIEDVK